MTPVRPVAPDPDAIPEKPRWLRLAEDSLAAWQCARRAPRPAAVRQAWAVLVGIERDDLPPCVVSAARGGAVELAWHADAGLKLRLILRGPGRLDWVLTQHGLIRDVGCARGSAVVDAARALVIRAVPPPARTGEED